jgi:NAD(P)H-nitrite reductase large subunit
MTIDEAPKGAILQRDKETYAIVPRIPAGLTSLENLKQIVRVVEKYQIPVIKITSGHDLNMDPGKATELCLHYVQACPGNSLCKFGVQDSLGMGVEIERFFQGRDLPAKLKIGVSGCPFCCGESFVRDIGLVGKKKGWTVIFGGSSARQPRVGDILAEDLPKDEAIRLISHCLEYYIANGKKHERTARFIERIGIDAFRKAAL